MESFKDKNILKLTAEEIIKMCSTTLCNECIFSQDWSGEYNDCSFGMFPADWDLMIKLNKTLMPKGL